MNSAARVLLACCALVVTACGPGDAMTNSESADEGSAAQEVTSGVTGVVRRGEEKQFGPFESTNAAVTVTMTGTGDADLLVRMGRSTCEPGLVGTNETCHLKGPGEFYVSVTGIESSSSFTLSIRYTRSHRDAGVDAGSYDGGSVDGGDVDGGPVIVDGGDLDGGQCDGGALDGGQYDGGVLDGGALDGGASDGGDLDGGSCGGSYDCNPNGVPCCVTRLSECSLYCR